jgi:hypothetical protein
VTVRHISSIGEIIGHDAIETKLMALSNKTDDDFFEPMEKRLAAAYRDRASKVAFAERKTDADKPAAVE